MKAFFQRLKNHMTNKHSSRLSLLLSVVALIEIIAIAGVSTYAWVETVSTIRIYTSNDSQSNAPATKTGAIMAHNNQIADVTPVSDPSTWINLSDMIHESGEFHLAPATSADGKNIFFPSANNGTTRQYRKATIDDFNVNFISISFKVKNAASYLFSVPPTIKFGTTTVNTSSSYSNLVRIGFTVGTGTSTIFGDAPVTENVINNINGTGTASTSVQSYSDYVSGTAASPVFTTSSANQIVTMRIWIQDQNFSKQTVYSGKKITIENFKLVPCYKATAKFSVNGSESSDTSIATVKIGSAGDAASCTRYFAKNQQASFQATIVNDSNYQFEKWASNANGSTTVSTNNPYNQNMTADVTYYAIIKQKVTISAQVALGTTAQNVTTYGTVKVGNNSEGATSSGTYTIGSTVTLTATPAENYSVVGWYKNGLGSSNFVANSNKKTSLEVTANASDTYYVSFEKNKEVTLWFTLTKQEDSMTVYVYGKTTNQEYNGAWPGYQTDSGNSDFYYYKNRGLYRLVISSPENEDFGVQINGDNTHTYTGHFTDGANYILENSSWNTVSSSTISSNRYYYFTNNYNWANTIKCHSWTNTNGTVTNSTTWPGTKMTNIYTNSNNQTVYMIRLASTKNRLIINNDNNGDQTEDIVTDTGNTGRYYISGDGTGPTDRRVSTW